MCNGSGWRLGLDRIFPFCSTFDENRNDNCALVTNQHITEANLVYIYRKRENRTNVRGHIFI